MAKIKSFTDIEQSKKLAEILPLESADAFYIIGKEPVDIVPIYGSVTHQHLREQMAYKRAIPCWSLAALLEQLPYELCDDDGNSAYLEIIKEDEVYQLVSTDPYGDFECIETDRYEDFVDACYEIISKLYELNLL